MKSRLLFFSVAVVVFTAATVEAQRVVYVCPEGTYMTTFFGLTECTPINGGKSDRPVETRPERPNIGSTALGVSIIGSKVLADMARVVKDPRYKGYSEGEWFFDEPTSGEACSATFMRRGIGVTLLGPSRRLPGAFLIFFGPDLPVPTVLSKARVTLSQTGEKPATVQALNSIFPVIDNYGAVILQVPTVEAAVDGIEDVHKFGIAIQDKKLVEIEWSGGLAARDRLKRCIQRKP